MLSIPNPLSSNTNRLWPVVAGAAAMAAAFATRTAVASGWRKVRHEDPPRNPASSDTSWPTALVWTSAVALLAGLARLVALRGTAAAWEKATGDEPPVQG